MLRYREGISRQDENKQRRDKAVMAIIYSSRRAHEGQLQVVTGLPHPGSDFQRSRSYFQLMRGRRKAEITL